MADMSLKFLFSRVREGESEAFEQIYQQLKQPVYTICWRIVQSKETAEDLTHDVFVKLYVTPPDSSVVNIRAWVFRIAHNLAIDSLRKEHGSDIEKEQAVEESRQIHMRLDLEAAMNKLPCLEREILSLHVNAGLNFGEIGIILNLSLPATYRRYRKALKTLQCELNGGNI